MIIIMAIFKMVNDLIQFNEFYLHVSDVRVVLDTLYAVYTYGSELGRIDRNNLNSLSDAQRKFDPIYETTISHKLLNARKYNVKPALRENKKKK